MMAPPVKRRRLVMSYRRVLMVLVLGTVLALVAGAVAGVLLAHGGVFGGAEQTAISASQIDLPLGAALTVSGDFDVDGGPLPLSPSQLGTIKAVLVHDGQRVAANAPLIELDSTLYDTRVEEARATVQAAQAKVDVAEQDGRNYAERVKQAKLSIEAAEKNLESFKTSAALLEKQVKAETKDKLELMSAQQRISAGEKELEKARSQLKELESTDPSLLVRAANAEKTRAEALLQAAKKARSDCTLTAPVSGVVLEITAGQGQVWNGFQQTPAIWFRPDKAWIVRCEVEQRYVYRVKEGMPCDVFDDRVDKPSWTGKVQSCGRWIRPPRQKLEGLAFRDIRVMECVVLLDKPQPEPMIGQRVRVIFHGQPSP